MLTAVRSLPGHNPGVVAGIRDIVTDNHAVCLDSVPSQISGPVNASYAWGHEDRAEEHTEDNRPVAARESRRQRWWRDLADQLPHDFLDLVGLEEDVSRCRGFEPGLVPGLFQTPQYAEAVIRGGAPGALDEDEQTKHRVRMEREKLVTESDAPMSVWMILGEAALRQEVGGRLVLAEQLEHLAELAQLPHVTLQVLPFTAGAYLGGPYPFSIYGFPKPSNLEVVVLESHTSQLYLESPADAKYYGEAFDGLRASALGALDSQSLMKEIAEELRH